MYSLIDIYVLNRITTHNNDCQECDLRITHVPAKTWPKGSKRPVYDINDAYPRYVETEHENIHGPEYLVANTDYSIFNWSVSVPIGYIDQVEQTYGYTLGTYAIQNEKQLSIGESTCSSLFVNKPITVEGGKSLFHMETLTEIALERCDTARCAILLMGNLSTQYGFYGDGYDGDLVDGQDEAGEALTIADPNETWMFHIMADDTGGSAIWVAQRVPDDHITVVANQFVIGEIDINDKNNYLASSNIFTVAERNNLWSSKSNIPFNFARIYGTNRHETSYACTRRVWRVLTMAAPSLLPIFSPYTDGYASFGYGVDFKDPYPFSVKVDNPQTLQDIMRMNRDQFEGTVFDMTKNIDAGPFGDPMRYLPSKLSKDPINGINPDDLKVGLGYQRQISLWRTAYSTITQSRSHLPDVIGAITWIAPYAPHHSQFVPIYANAPDTPVSMKIATEYKLNKGSNWWIHCLASNYLSKWYIHTIEDINNFQKEMEVKLFKLQSNIEQTALKLYIPSVSVLPVITILQEYQNIAAKDVLDSWWDFFFDMVGKYRDVYKVINPHAESFSKAFTYLNIPRWYLEQIGYWGPPGTKAPSAEKSSDIYPINVPSEDSLEIYQQKYPNGYYEPYKVNNIYTSDNCKSNIAATSGGNAVNIIYAALLSATFASIVTYFILKRGEMKTSYTRIN